MRETPARERLRYSGVDEQGCVGERQQQQSDYEGGDDNQSVGLSALALEFSDIRRAFTVEPLKSVFDHTLTQLPPTLRPSQPRVEGRSRSLVADDRLGVTSKPSNLLQPTDRKYNVLKASLLVAHRLIEGQQV